MGICTQLTQVKRYQIHAFMKADFSQADRAQEIGVYRSAICRELRRNRGKSGYRPKQAHAMACERGKKAQKYTKLIPRPIALIEDFIRHDLSPEQVSGFLERRHNCRISHETIYQHVLENKATGGDSYCHLRHSHKRRRKRCGSHDRRGQIKDRASIDERTAIVDTRKRIGDWEIDTIIGKTIRRP